MNNTQSKATPQQFVEAWVRAYVRNENVATVARQLGMAPDSVRARARTYQNKYGVNLPPLKDTRQVITKKVVPALNEHIATMLAEARR